MSMFLCGEVGRGIGSNDDEEEVSHGPTAVVPSALAEEEPSAGAGRTYASQLRC